MTFKIESDQECADILDQIDTLKNVADRVQEEIQEFERLVADYNEDEENDLNNYGVETDAEREEALAFQPKDDVRDLTKVQCGNREWCYEEDLEPDMVREPPHYLPKDDSGIECIHAQKAMLGSDVFVGHCQATALKYVWREKIDKIQDFRKAIKYLEFAIDELEERIPF